MRLFLPVISSFLALNASSQITITTNDLPDAGDTIVTRNAAFLEDVDIEATGANHTWSFGFDILEPLNLNAGIVCYDVDETPIVYQFMFNNPFDAAHNSDFAVGVQQAGVAGVSFENAYMYYQNSPTKYAITGMGASINGLPLAAHMNEPDLLYNLPLTFGSLDTSHTTMTFDVPQLGFYGLDQTRSYECDGWGTLSIWEQSFEVLRVKSIINASDSVFTSFINMGIRLPRPETVTYEWISTEHIAPILKVTTTGGNITQVQVADIYQDPTSVKENEELAVSIYPNPSSDVLNVVLENNSIALAQIFDAQGRLMKTERLNKANSLINITSLAKGRYILQLTQGEKTQSHSFIKE